MILRHSDELRRHFDYDQNDSEMRPTDMIEGYS